MKRFFDALYDAAGAILLSGVILLSMFGLFTAIDIGKGRLVWKTIHQQPPVASAVTQADLKALMDVIAKRDAAQKPVNY